jgi:hypothetical protein
MPQSVNAQSDFLNWLSSDKCVPWLMQQARYLLARGSELCLPYELWPHGDPNELPEGELISALDEMAHEFWLFIRGYLSEGGADLPWEVAPSGNKGLSLTGAYLRSAFLNRLRGLARRKNKSPRRHLYRRLRETLQSAPGFYYLAQRERAYFSMVEEAPLTNIHMAQVEGEYRDWPSPCELVSEKQLYGFKSEHLCSLAGLFWNEAATRLSGAHYLPIWELAAYLIAHYGFFQDGEKMTTEYSDTLAAGGLGLLSPDKGGLQLLAAQLVASWSPRRRMVFQLAIDSGELTYQEISDWAGLSGASHAKYHLDRACRELADFCETWPGVTPPPTERAFWTEFLMITAEVCRNSLQGRPLEIKDDQLQSKEVP